jgi:hypothetical protein
MFSFVSDTMNVRGRTYFQLSVIGPEDPLCSQDITVLER